MYVFLQKGIGWDTDNVFFHDGVFVDEVVDSIRREDMLQFQPVDAVGIDLLDIEVVEVVINCGLQSVPEREACFHESIDQLVPRIGSS